MGMRNPENTTMTISLPKEMLKEIDAYCQQNDLTRTQYIRRLIKSDKLRIIPFEAPQAQNAKVAEEDAGYIVDKRPIPGHNHKKNETTKHPE